jgi:hypothetical protein
MAATMKLFNLLTKNPKKAGTFAHVDLLNKRDYCGSGMTHIQDIDMLLFRNAWISKTPVMVKDTSIMIRDKTSDVCFTLIHIGKKNFSVTQSSVLREDIQSEEPDDDLQARLNRILAAYDDQDSDED